MKMIRVMASLVFAVALLTTLGGCGALKLPAALDGLTPVSRSEADAEPAKQPRGTFEVLMKSKFGKNSKSTQPLVGTVLLQDVVEASGAVKKFRAMEITIYRPVKGSPVPLQMQCEYDSGEDSVSQAENYEIYPGDQVLIEEVAGSKLGKMLGDLSPLDR